MGPTSGEANPGQKIRNTCTLHENEIGDIVVDCALQVHRELGPGLLESVYELVLCKEMELRGLPVLRQVQIPITYRGMVFETGFRADIIIASRVLLEIKSITCLQDVHKKQLLTYLRLSNLRLGYLLNFGESLMKTGIVRIANNLTPPEPKESSNIPKS